MIYEHRSSQRRRWSFVIISILSHSFHWMDIPLPGVRLYYSGNKFVLIATAAEWGLRVGRWGRELSVNSWIHVCMSGWKFVAGTQGHTPDECCANGALVKSAKQGVCITSLCSCILIPKHSDSYSLFFSQHRLLLLRTWNISTRAATKDVLDLCALNLATTIALRSLQLLLVFRAILFNNSNFS